MNPWLSIHMLGMQPPSLQAQLLAPIPILVTRIKLIWTSVADLMIFEYRALVSRPERFMNKLDFPKASKVLKT